MLAWIIIYVVGLVGLYWAYHCSQLVLKIDVVAPAGVDAHTQEHYKSLIDIGDKIAAGADAFLMAEYKIIGIFICAFGALVFFIVDVSGSTDAGFGFYATFSFLVGSITSMLCGYIGMKIAVQANFRTTFKATEALSEAFKTAYSAGCVMGFSMISISMMLLTLLMQIYVSLYSPVVETDSPRSYAVLMEMLAGYGLGGSCIALFGRVGGGIYTKAADVGADLVGKVEQDLAEDSPRNPATIADNVGDNVGDIAGMGSDLFGSFAESTCAALVFIATTQDLINSPLSLAYPILVSAFGKQTSSFRYHGLPGNQLLWHLCLHCG